jgi:hypothetical protein
MERKFGKSENKKGDARIWEKKGLEDPRSERRRTSEECSSRGPTSRRSSPWGERERADAGGKVSWSGAGGGEGRGRPGGAVEVLGALAVVAGGGEGGLDFCSREAGQYGKTSQQTIIFFTSLTCCTFNLLLLSPNEPKKKTRNLRIVPTRIHQSLYLDMIEIII